MRQETLKVKMSRS